MSEDRADETEASYPDSGSVRNSREGGSDELEEVEDGVGEGGLKLQTGAPLSKYQGHVMGSLWGVSSVWGLVWPYQVLVDLVSLWSQSQRVSLSIPGLCPGCWSIWAIISNMTPLLCLGKYWLMCNIFSNSPSTSGGVPFPSPCHLFRGLQCLCHFFPTLFK